MTTEEKIARRKLNLLDLALELCNVSRALLSDLDLLRDLQGTLTSTPR